MLKYVWLVILAMPPWAAAEFDAPKWVVIVALVPFFLVLSILGDPDENLLGEASGKFRKGALGVMGVGGLVLGVVFFILWQVFFPKA
ncbi:hypothetical protein [Polaromonas sp.]|uniref:hypothetical protein n=1 Tax=Polaromonas sp. TaxID=1869339 RepID=UPI0032659286